MIKLSKLITTNLKGQAYSRRIPVQGIKVLQRWVHDAVSSEDDFVELGPPSIQGVNTRLKLATEKPEVFKWTNDKVNNSSKLEGMGVPNAKNLLCGLGNFSRASTKVEKPKNISKISSSSKCKSKVKNSSSISIDNVPSAVLEGEITVDSFHLPIRSEYDPDSVTIRIKDISEDTAYTAVHSICKTIGELVGMVQATENSIDVLFNIKELSDAQNILAELNNKIVDDCQWSAHLLPEPSIPDAVSTNEMSEFGQEVSNLMSELRNNFSTRKIDLEDLEYMHLAIMHLGEHHTVDTGSKRN